MASEETLNKICAFHTGRGGSFYNNPGFTQFVGFKKIDDFTDELFKAYEKQKDVIEDTKEKFEEDGKEFDESRFYDLLTEHEYGDNSIELFEEFGINADDLGELYWFDCGGKITRLKVENDGTGCIDIDGEYDTTTCVFLKDCSESELKMILNSKEYINPFVMEYLKEQLPEEFQEEIEEEIEE